MSYISPLVSTNSLVRPGNTSNQSAQLQTINPKAAHPHFAAVPLKSNQFCYGPWTNYPHFDMKTIFHPTLQRFADNITENMIDNVKVEKNDDFVPWNYGGMTSLDNAVATTINENTDYQSILEQGSASIKGPPIFEPGGAFGDLLENLPRNTRSHPAKHLVIPSIGSLYLQNNAEYFIESTILKFAEYNVNRPSPLAQALSYVGIRAIPKVLDFPTIIVRDIRYNSFLGPVISNMSLNVDSNGINTSYSFRTFSRKTGAWNKENVDRIKKENLNAIQNNKKFRALENKTNANIKAQVQNILDNSRDRATAYSTAGMESKLFGASPTEILIGQSRPSTKIYNFGFDAVLNAPQTTGNSLGSVEKSKEGDKILKQNALAAGGNIFQLSYGQDPGDDVKTNALYNTNIISGLMTARRHASWVGMYMADEVGAELVKEYGTKAAMSLDGIFSPVSFYPTAYNSTYAISSYPNSGGVVCPRCNGTGLITEDYVEPASGDKSSQPFACPVCSKSKVSISADDNIHLYSLNPIVVPYGEFRNPNVQNSGNTVDRCRHSIGVVGRGEYNQTADQSFYIPSNLEKYIDPNTGLSVNGTGQGVIADYYEYDIFRNQIENTNTKVPLNHRFFSFRGPMTLHGWGYDTEGYPVPNAADEPKFLDAFSRPKRFFKKADGTNDLEKDGAFLPVGSITLGDVIGKGYEKVGGKWTKIKSDYFYLNWAERPDTWPVGPIDIRWDEERKVWAAGGGGGCGSDLLPPYIVASGVDINVISDFIGTNKKKCPYKTVYVTLEEDLVTEYGASESYPSRAFLDDLQFDQSPLPRGARRVVYVKDRCGYSAPRGAKLLCKYDSDYGFYEPITKPNYIVFGNISSGNQAIINLTYIQGRKRGESIPTMSVNFDNSKLQLNINNRASGQPAAGMFLYENGKWILVSVN
jgi:hypothetical protein